MKFEAYGSSPEFTNLVQKFCFGNCNQIKEISETGEHSIDNYLIFQKYSELIETELNKFLTKENFTQDEFYAACEFARDENLPCNFLDYILSSIEYEDFYYLMMDYKNMGVKECNEDIK